MWKKHENSGGFGDGRKRNGKPSHLGLVVKGFQLEFSFWFRVALATCKHSKWRENSDFYGPRGIILSA